MRATAASALLSLLPFLLAACAGDGPKAGGALQGQPTLPTRPLVIQAGTPVADVPGERHLRNVRKLSRGGENAEAYWSSDGQKLIYQSKRPPYDCDQIFIVDLESGKEHLVSTGKGKTTCSYFLRGDQQVIFSSTHLRDPACPVVGRIIRGRYVWPIFPGYDVFRCNLDGSDLTRITTAEGYDAEATVCPVTGRIVFTSGRDGDMDIYSMEPDGSDVQRLTNREGYDGGPFYSPDGSKIVLRSGFFQNDQERDEYRSFLKENLLLPERVELTVMQRDGSGFHKVTDNGAANFAPYWHPDNHRIIFCSNYGQKKGSRNFDLFLIAEDGTGLEQVTTFDHFDGFPMFSPDGKHIAFASNRYGEAYGETNIFVAEWVE